MSDTHGGQPAGWYPDPEMADTLRYWDGAAWTEHRAPMGQTTPPTAPLAAATVAPKAKSPWAKLTDGQRALIVLGVLAAIIALTVAANLGGDDEPPTALDPGAYSSTREVLYEIEGTAPSVDITIETPSGTSQQSDLAVPVVSQAGEPGLRITFNAGDFVYISAQNQGDAGTVTCRITVDGTVISENTASGAYAIASCDGRA